MLYSFLEMSRAAMLPWRAAANMTRRSLRSPLNPASDTLAGRATAAAADLFESLTRYYGKPDWELSPTHVNDQPVYRAGGGWGYLEERSDFSKENGFWFYREGETREGVLKPGRNDRCPCGSGRKFKACCL